MNKFLSLLALASTLVWVNAQDAGQIGGGGQDVTTASAAPTSMAPMIAPEESPLAATELAAVSPVPIELEPPAVAPAETKSIEQIAGEMEGKNLAEAEDIVTAPAVEQPIALDVAPEVKPTVATVPVAESSLMEPSTVEPSTTEPLTEPILTEPALTEPVKTEPEVETVKPAETTVPDMVQNPQPEPGTIADLT